MQQILTQLVQHCKNVRVSVHITVAVVVCSYANALGCNVLSAFRVKTPDYKKVTTSWQYQKFGSAVLKKMGEQLAPRKGAEMSQPREETQAVSFRCVYMH